ncbi:MAG: YchJ family metal-binding protein [Campylobacterota bacterium]|nr:YchJ family metal-binding protein [Campylobacterota bacterium]
MKFSVNSTCPCGSGKKYKKCCQPFHKGANPKTALDLMRSRYCAFYLNLPKYIIKTTHPNNPDFSTDIKQWTKDIVEFSTSCEFLSLEILESNSYSPTEATVTFKANILSNGEDISFVEKSQFYKLNNIWLYCNML